MNENLCAVLTLGYSLSKHNFKGALYDSGERLLIFELNSKTNTLLPSVLLQKLCPPNSWTCIVEANTPF